MSDRKKSFLELMPRFSRCRAAVVGDLMLDVYLWGSVSRISPEAPVPVFSFARRTSCPGGAANVARNLATLKAQAFVCGVTGEDEAARELRKHFDELGINTSLLRCDASRPTTEKRRIIASGQQLLREDFEKTAPLSAALQQELRDPLLAMIESRQCDLLIFEDYAKGVLSTGIVEELISAAQRCGIITALDPKPGNLRPCRGLTVMKPNRSEAFALAGMVDPSAERQLPPERDEALRLVAEKLLVEWAPRYLLISLASQGLALYAAGERPRLIPTRAREVFDVSGAGDTVTAAFTLALAAGAAPEEAAELANAAAGVVVGKIGTAPIHWDELFSELNR